MHKANMIAYVILSGAAPILVLMNSLFGTEAASSSATVQPLQSMQLVQRLMNSGPKNLVTADDLMPEVSVPYPHARIVIENHQAFLEFYSPFSMAAQTPNLLLILDTAPVPSDTFFLSDRQPENNGIRFPPLLRCLSIFLWWFGALSPMPLWATHPSPLRFKATFERIHSLSIHPGGSIDSPLDF